MTVTYLWTGDQTGKSCPTWGTDVRVRQQATTASPNIFIDVVESWLPGVPNC